MTRTVPLLLLLSLLLPSAAAAQPQTSSTSAPLTNLRVAYFSPQRAFASSPDGKTALTNLSALEATKAREIETRNVELTRRRAALEASAGSLNPAARRQREQDVARFEIDVQRFIQDAQAELAGFQRSAESAFLAKVRPALEQVVKDKGLSLVLNEDAGLLAWADPALDVTADVVSRISP
jgi:Skp family chaperone for outer membrane proteins